MKKRRSATGGARRNTRAQSSDSTRTWRAAGPAEAGSSTMAAAADLVDSRRVTVSPWHEAHFNRSCTSPGRLCNKLARSAQPPLHLFAAEPDNDLGEIASQLNARP